jgi:hypothetical protein
MDIKVSIVITSQRACLVLSYYKKTTLSTFCQSILSEKYILFYMINKILFTCSTIVHLVFLSYLLKIFLKLIYSFATKRSQAKMMTSYVVFC